MSDRFWSKVRKAGPDDCWLWTAALTRLGYGHFKVKGKLKSAHRVAFEHGSGEIPPSMCVLHRCDKPSCVNPDHLFLGTHDDNMKDMARKGRGRSCRGADSPQAKLNEFDVCLIRHWASRGYKQREICVAFGVDRSTIGYIVRGDRWRHVV